MRHQLLLGFSILPFLPFLAFPAHADGLSINPFPSKNVSQDVSDAEANIYRQQALQQLQEQRADEPGVSIPVGAQVEVQAQEDVAPTVLDVQVEAEAKKPVVADRVIAEVEEEPFEEKLIYIPDEKAPDVVAVPVEPTPVRRRSVEGMSSIDLAKDVVGITDDAPQLMAPPAQEDAVILLPEPVAEPVQELKAPPVIDVSVVPPEAISQDFDVRVTDEVVDEVRQPEIVVKVSEPPVAEVVVEDAEPAVREDDILELDPIEPGFVYQPEGKNKPVVVDMAMPQEPLRAVEIEDMGYDKSALLPPPLAGDTQERMAQHKYIVPVGNPVVGQTPIVLIGDDVHGGGQQVPVSSTQPQFEGWGVSGEQSLRDVLSRWSDRAGVSLVWDTRDQFDVPSGFQHSGDYSEAISAMLDTYTQAPLRPVGQLFVDPVTGVKVLTIKSDNT